MQTRSNRLLVALLCLGPTAAAQTWTQLSPSQSPSARWQHTLSHDLFRDRFVMFGGRPSFGLHLDDTWEFDGSTWTQIATTTQPTSRWLSCMEYDLSRAVTVLFGGHSAAVAALDDTWLWDGTTWTQAQPVNRPPGRNAAALAYDTNRSVMVLFGGNGTNNARLSDTWEWNGNDWTQIFPTNRPSARVTRMVYDAARRRMVIFGGESSLNQYDDETWEFDGSNWYQVFTATTPIPRVTNLLTYDTTRQRVVMYGGLDQTFALQTDNWEYDGANWIPINPIANLPAIRDFDNTAYDPLNSRVFLFGGITNTITTIATNATWTFTGANTGLFSAYGPACSATGQAPTIAGTVPTIGQSLDLTFQNLGPATGILVVLGTSDQQWNGQPLPIDLAALGLPGCDLRCSADFTAFLFASGGTASFSWLLPANPAILNQAAFCQGLRLDLNSGLTVTGATELGRVVFGN